MKQDEMLKQLLVGQVLILEILLTMESRVSLLSKDLLDRKVYAISLLEKHHEKILEMLKTGFE